MELFVDTDPGTRLFRVTTGFNEAVYLAANEPSIGLYRLQEHVTVTVPRLVEDRLSIEEMSSKVRGATYDLEYDAEALKSVQDVTNFQRILSSVQRAIKVRKLLLQREMERKREIEQKREKARADSQQHPSRAQVSPRTVRRDYGSISTTSRHSPLTVISSINSNPIPSQQTPKQTDFSGTHLAPKQF